MRTLINTNCKMKEYIERWNRYWFSPAPLAQLAACRIVLVGVQLILLVQLNVYNYNRLADLALKPDSSFKPLPVFTLLTWPLGPGFRPSYEFLIAAYSITLAVGTLALVGFKTNISLALFVLGVIFLQAFSYSFSEFHHPEPPMIFALTLLALSPAGRVLSIDGWRRRRLAFKRGTAEVPNVLEEKSAFARWPLLLSGWLLALMYLDAALSKLGNGGFTWMNGYTLQYKIANSGVELGNNLAVWLSQQHTIVWLLSLMTIWLEGTFFLVLIFPVLALVYIPMGVMFHVGLCVVMEACFWQWTAVYAVFIPWVSILAILSQRLQISVTYQKAQNSPND
jgi:hypothetical protein